jgi:hypothetical protein
VRVRVHEELKYLSGGTLSQIGLLSRATASNSCMKNIGPLKISPDRTPYCKVGEREGYYYSSSSFSFSGNHISFVMF